LGKRVSAQKTALSCQGIGNRAAGAAAVRNSTGRRPGPAGLSGFDDVQVHIGLSPKNVILSAVEKHGLQRGAIEPDSP